MSDVKKIKRIQVPIDLITKPKQYYELYLYVFLRSVCVNNHVKIYTRKLMEILGWKDNKTLKKYLESLKIKNLIKIDIKNLPIHSPLELDIVPIKKGIQFTQIDVDTVYRVREYMSCITYNEKNKITGEYDTVVEDVKERAMKLIYYYETYYNADYNCAFTSYARINQETGISNTYIKVINKAFHKNNLVDVEIGEQYIDEDNNLKRKTNRYVPLIERKYHVE